MPAIRTGRADQTAMAIEDLTTIANRSAGLSISLLTPPDRVTIEGVGSNPWHAKVHQRSSLSPREARMLVTTATRGTHGEGVDPSSYRRHLGRSERRLGRAVERSL